MTLTLSQLIPILEKLLEEHGDLPVEKACHETYGSIQYGVEGAELEESHTFAGLKRYILL